MRNAWIPASMLVVVLTAAVLPAGAGTKTVGTWSDPELEPATYAKVVVYARFTDDLARRVLEDAVASGLKDRGVETITAYSTFTEADLAGEEATRAKVDELGVDAAVVFSVAKQDTQVKSGPAVHASVGVPVRVGPFSMFVGTSVPLGGGPSQVDRVQVKSEFYALGREGPLWIGTYSTDLGGGAERAAKEIAAQTLKRLKKAAVFE